MGEMFAQEKKCTDGARNFAMFLQFLTAALFSPAEELCIALVKVVYLYKVIE